MSRSGSAKISGFVYEKISGLRTTSNLKSETDTPAAGANVYLQELQEDEWITVAATVSDEDGFYEFSDLPAGTYRVVLDIPGLGMINIPKTIELTDSDVIRDIDIEIRDNGIHYVDGLVSIPCIKTDGNTLQVFPNPAISILNVQLKETVNNGTLALYDLTGKIVLSQTVTGSSFQINLSPLASGKYILRLSDNGKVWAGIQVIKQ